MGPPATERHWGASQRQAGPLRSFPTLQHLLLRSPKWHLEADVPPSHRPGPASCRAHHGASGTLNSWSRGRRLPGELLAPLSLPLWLPGQGLLLPGQAAQLENHRPAPEPGTMPAVLTQSFLLNGLSSPGRRRGRPLRGPVWISSGRPSAMASAAAPHGHPVKAPPGREVVSSLEGPARARNGSCWPTCL